jgi:hypothetical protein
MSSFDLEQLGLTMQAAGNAINDRIDHDFKTLEFTQIHEMSNRAQELFMKSKTLFAMATIELGNEAKKDLEALQQATGEIATAIKQIEKVQKVINLTAKLIGVAGQIIAGDLKSVPKSVKEVLAELQS